MYTKRVIIVLWHILKNIVIYSYADACMHAEHNDTIKTTSGTLYWKGCVWEGVGDQTELQHIDPHSIGHNCISFPFFWAAQSGAWGPSLFGCWFSLPHLISNSSDLQTAQWGPWGPLLLSTVFSTASFLQLWLNFLCTELYNSSTPTQSLPINGQQNMQLPPSLEWHVLIIIKRK